MSHPDPELPETFPSWWTTRNVPPPGSADAIRAGCRCPELDNARGRGRPGPEGERWFVFVTNCPLHGNADWAR
jgi:hypothetical protein